MRLRSLCTVSLTLFATSGCVDRIMTIDSNPDGAVVYLNDQEVGRTPLERDFQVYGNYEVQVRKEGYTTVKTNQEMQEPWWQLIPADLVAELLPFRFQDRRHFQYSMTPTTQASADPQLMLAHGAELRSMLLSSPHTRLPTSVPATEPSSPK